MPAYVRGITLKLERIERRVTQAELGASAGWTRQHVGRTEQRDLVPAHVAVRFRAALRSALAARGGL